MSNWAARLKKVEQSFQQTPLVTCYKPHLWPWQPSSIWKLFPRQSMAISFCQSCKEEVHVFALEKEDTTPGQRVYLVTSYCELWHYYRTYRQSLMHCYEVIPEGVVCKLYFDLEFHRPANEGLDGRAMVSSLIEYVCEKLMVVYGIACTGKDILNLDSSTAEKFSRHLIFLLPNAAFKDNIHAGRFIHAILQQVLNTPESRTLHPPGDAPAQADCPQADSPEADCPEADCPRAKRLKQEERDLSFLSVKNKQGQECLFVDLGVYTRNRNFRLYKSSKVGKNAAFTVAEDNMYVAKPQRNISAEESLFLASLVSNVSFTGQRILTWDVPDTEEPEATRPLCQLGSTNDSGLLGGTGYKCSPYPEVDNFVLTVTKRDEIQGGIRRWSYFVSEQLIVYDILKYRWCENVDRCHKSNNIMIIVDLKEDVWYQKCHDPACKNFRSSSYPLPEEICVGYLMAMDEEDQAFLMDDAGNIEPSPAPGRGQQSAGHPEDGAADGLDDGACLEALEEFESSAERTEEISDQLLLQCMAQFDSH